MEVGVRLVGIILRLLDFLLSPLFWLKGRPRRIAPPLRNHLLMRSAKQLAEAIKNGEHTSEEITSMYIDRVKEVNPYLNAVVDERYRAALEEAKGVDRQIEDARKNGSLNELVKGKPLLGVPFTVKESCSLGGMSNSVGVVDQATSRALRDGRCVHRARLAGAIPLLVTSTPELCLGWETTNLLRGATNNPHHLGKTPAGSSGGEEKFTELEDSVEISLSVFFSMKDIPNMLQDPADPKRDRSLLAEMVRHVVGAGRRSLQALSFELIHRTKLFIPDHRTPYYTRKADRLRERMTEVLGKNGVFIYPVFNELAHYHNQVFLKASGVMYTMVFNILGMPATAVPVDTKRGLPVAIQVIAAPYQDRLCLAVARQLEIGFGGWRPPN